MSTIVVKRPVATTASPIPRSMGKNKNSAAAKEAKEVEKAAAKESISSELMAYGCSMALLFFLHLGVYRQEASDGLSSKCLRWGEMVDVWMG